MTGIIFAAGIGSRLKPFTDFHPKAIAEVRGVPAVVRVARRLIDAGVDRLIVNVHHFPQQVIDCLERAELPVKVEYSHEEDCLLDTGGALAKIAREHPELTVGTEPVIVHNADIFTDFSIDEMRKAYTSVGVNPAKSTSLAVGQCDALLLIDPQRQSSRRFVFSDAGLMIGWINEITGATKPAAFTTQMGASGHKAAFGGVHIIAPRLLNLLAQAEQGAIFSITDFYLQHCSELDIRAFTPSEPFAWFDIGTPEKLAAANA